MCDICLISGKPASGIPKWYQAGYRQKSKCEKCGFKSTHKEQIRVFHVDGDLNNVRYTNLKSVCANCQIELQRENSRWKQGDLVPDL